MLGNNNCGFLGKTDIATDQSDATSENREEANLFENRHSEYRALIVHCKAVCAKDIGKVNML